MQDIQKFKNKPNDKDVDLKTFIILASQRSGSNYLQSLFNSHIAISVGGEIFNESHDKTNNMPEIKPFAHLRKQSPVKYLQEFYQAKSNENITHRGFRLFYRHARTNKEVIVWDYLKSIDSLKVIHLRRRNYLESLLSFKLAMQSAVWIRKKGEPVIDFKSIYLDYAECLEFFNKHERDWRQFDGLFKDNQKITLYYEDLVNNKEREEIRCLEFLEVKPVHPLTSALVKMNTQSLSKSILNYAELKNEFKETRWHVFFEE